MRPLSVPIALVLLAIPGGLARAHEPPAFYHLVRADEERLTWEVIVRPEFLRTWVGGDGTDRAALDEAERRALRPRLVERLASWAPVRVDGIAVAPLLTTFEPLAFEDHGQTFTYERLLLTYGLKGRPRRIELAWTQYATPASWSVREVDMELEAFGVTEYPALTAKEPGFTLHVTPAAPAPPPFEPPAVRVTPRTPVPLLSLAAVLLAGLLLVLGIRGRLRLRAVGVACLALGALAFALRDTATVALRAPWAAAWTRPGVEEAGRIFESLHRNIYRAFDYDTEDAIYATLARSVRGDLLDSLYAEVFASLVMKEEGGAVSRVLKTEILDQQVTFPDEAGAPYFDVVCRWRVHGKVGHWGHTHLRINEYRARYRVVQEGEAWTIAAASLLDQRRIDDGTLR